MFSVCPHLGGGGYPYPIMLCNISQNAMGQPGGVPCQVRGGGTLPGGTLQGVPCWGVPCWGVPCQRGVPCQGGTLPGGGTLLGGYPVRTTEEVFTTRRAVCLLRSRRRTFLFIFQKNRCQTSCRITDILKFTLSSKKGIQVQYSLYLEQSILEAP